MPNASEPFNCISLCDCCIAENEESNCSDKNSTPFIKNKAFNNGKYLCASGKNPDCVYQYDENKIIAIEIKDQPENNIKYDNLVGKIENSYKCACDNGSILMAFILQVSSIKNSSKNKNQLLVNCQKGLGVYHLRIGRDGKLHSKNKDLKNINTKFDIIKCKDFDDKYFKSMLI
jgi:hypothetical protein